MSHQVGEFEHLLAQYKIRVRLRRSHDLLDSIIHELSVALHATKVAQSGEVQAQLAPLKLELEQLLEAASALASRVSKLMHESQNKN